MAEQAVTIAEAALELVPARVEKPDAEKAFGELLHEGTRAALIAGRDICRAYEPDADLKERRLVSETAGWIARLGVRVAEAELRARKDDTVGQLLEKLRVVEAVD